MSDILGLMAAGSGRAADGRNGPPRRLGQAAAVVELPKIEGKVMPQKSN